MANGKPIGMIAVGAVFFLLMGSSSFAVVVNPTDPISFSFAPNHASNFGGGAFLAYDSKSQSSWYTFCLEYDEHISLGSTYTVDSVVPYATGGGGGSTGGIDYISSQTAYLYYLYATSGLGFTDAGSTDQQKGLQNAFWFLENEIATLPGDYWTQYYYNKAINEATPGQYYGVLVVNPVTLAGGPSQSQLVYVPEPGSFLLLGSGLIGLIAYRRKRRTE